MIDDNPQDDLFDGLKRKAKAKQIQLNCYQFNVGSEQTDFLTDGNIDIEKVEAIFKSEFDGRKLDIICVDYNLEDERITGLDVLRRIYNLRKTSIYMLYSSSLDQVAKGIIDTYDQDKNKNKLINRIKTLTSYRISEFSPRDRYEDDIIKLLATNQSPLELVMETKLLEYGDLEFENTYPLFQGWKLKDIATEIRKSTPQGNKFKVQLIEQALAYMIKINS